MGQAGWACAHRPGSTEHSRAATAVGGPSTLPPPRSRRPGRRRRGDVRGPAACGGDDHAGGSRGSVQRYPYHPMVVRNGHHARQQAHTETVCDGGGYGEPLLEVVGDARRETGRGARGDEHLVESLCSGFTIQVSVAASASSTASRRVSGCSSGTSRSWASSKTTVCSNPGIVDHPRAFGPGDRPAGGRVPRVPRRGREQRHHRVPTADPGPGRDGRDPVRRDPVLLGNDRAEAYSGRYRGNPAESGTRRRGAGRSTRSRARRADRDPGLSRVVRVALFSESISPAVAIRATPPESLAYRPFTGLPGR